MGLEISAFTKFRPFLPRLAIEDAGKVDVWTKADSVTPYDPDDIAALVLPLYRTLHSDPRFAALLREMDSPEENGERL